MRGIRKLWLRGAALCLAAMLLPGAAAAAAEPEKAARQEDLDFLYHTVLEENHPDLFANTPEAEFLALKEDIESRLEQSGDVEFLLDLMRLTALAGDSHTMISIGSAASFRMYPFAMARRGEDWYLSAVARENEDLLCQKIAALNGRSVEETAMAFGQLFSADNPVHLRRQFRQACNVADIYEYLGLAEKGEPLVLTLADGRTLSLEPADMEAANRLEIARLEDRITGEPATAAADACYLAKSLTDDAYYIQYNVCANADDLPMEDFAARVAADLTDGAYGRVLLDLRNNGGGSDGVIWPLLEVLRQAMDGGCELVGLIGERTFSSALINAVEIQEMGGVLAGEAAGGSVCHFGAVRTFSLPNSGVRGQLSSRYIDLNTLLDAGAGRGVTALEPDIAVPQTLEDTLAGRDTVVEWLLAHPERLARQAYPDAPLTRGRFIGQLYEAAGSPAVPEEALPFADNFGIEWYLPAVRWARADGVTLGTADGGFAAARRIAWQEAAVFMVRAVQARGAEPEIVRTAPLPGALADTGDWRQDASELAWSWGLLPADADFSKTPTRAQGLEMSAAWAALTA